jgi:Na+-driven multidrug efflux pump
MDGAAIAAIIAAVFAGAASLYAILRNKSLLTRFLAGQAKQTA